MTSQPAARVALGDRVAHLGRCCIRQIPDVVEVVFPAGPAVIGMRHARIRFGGGVISSHRAQVGPLSTQGDPPVFRRFQFTRLAIRLLPASSAGATGRTGDSGVVGLADPGPLLGAEFFPAAALARLFEVFAAAKFLLIPLCSTSLRNRRTASCTDSLSRYTQPTTQHSCSLQKLPAETRHVPSPPHKRVGKVTRIPGPDKTEAALF